MCDPTDGSPPGSAAPGILQARTLEWVPPPLVSFNVGTWGLRGSRYGESSPSFPRSSHCGFGRPCDYLSDDTRVLCRGTDRKEFIRGFSERVFVMCLVVCTACRIYEHLRNQPPLESTFSASPGCQFPVMPRCLCQIKGRLEQTLHGISAE